MHPDTELDWAGLVRGPAQATLRPGTDWPGPLGPTCDQGTGAPEASHWSILSILASDWLIGTCRSLQRCSGALETNIWAAATVAGCCCSICILFLTPSRCIPFLLPPILEYFDFLFSIDGVQIGNNFSYVRTTSENVLECVILVSGCWAGTHTWPQQPRQHNSSGSQLSAPEIWPGQY